MADTMEDWNEEQLISFVNAQLDNDERAIREDGDGSCLPYAPIRMLRDIQNKRALVAHLAAQQHVVVEDCWYTCGAATEERDGGESCDEERGTKCDCGRDRLVLTSLRLLAAPYITEGSP